jgi:hypothetical protein
MFAFYSSISRLLSWNKTDTLTSKNSCSSLYPKITEIRNQLDTMLSPDSSMDVFIAKNDVDEIVILEYSKCDKTFVHYRPKYFNYK